MPKFQKSDGFQMKRGANPTFKDMGSSNSPVKVDWGQMEDTGMSQMGNIGGAIGGPMGRSIAYSQRRKMDGTAASEKKFEEQLEAEGLKRNFWGKLGFGGKRSKERKARIKEFEAQEQEGIDRDRIASHVGAPVAGPGA